MKRALIALMVLALAVPAFAGQNPDVRAFVTFVKDCPDPYVHRTDTVSGLVNIYLLLDCFGEDGGIRTVSLTWTTTGFGMAFAPTYYLVGAQVIGGPDNATDGWVIAAPNCTYPNECGVVPILNQPYFVMGPGTVTLGPNPVDGQMVVDCNFDFDLFCVLANGGVGMPAPEGDLDCECPIVPVEDKSWGGIKALYR
jgi:hypothetical protein